VAIRQWDPPNNNWGSNWDQKLSGQLLFGGANCNDKLIVGQFKFQFGQLVQLRCKSASHVQYELEIGNGTRI